MSYQLVESHRQIGRVETLCGALGVSVSGYYAWRKRVPSQHQQRDEALTHAIEAAYQAGRGVYGSPRVHAVLRQQGLHCSRKRVARRTLPQPATLIQHTDRGSQYTAAEYLALLKQHGIQVSMSDKGNPYDNAMMESFFSTLRAELTDLERFTTRQVARTTVFEFIEVFYNRQRLHSSLGYLSPLAFETDHLS